LASTGSGDTNGLDNAADAVSTDFLFNAPFAPEPLTLVG
jgi:hypothetical protein